MSVVISHSADNLVTALRAYNAPTVNSSSRTGVLVPVLAGTAACAIGALVLAGWFFDIRVFKQPVTSASPMMPNAALGFVLCGAALLVRARRPLFAYLPAKNLRFFRLSSRKSDRWFVRDKCRRWLAPV